MNMQQLALQSMCEKLEEEMLLFMLNYNPCDNMLVCDVKMIALVAKDRACRIFDLKKMESG